jgi:hypothetical protein
VLQAGVAPAPLAGSSAQVMQLQSVFDVQMIGMHGLHAINFVALLVAVIDIIYRELEFCLPHRGCWMVLQVMCTMRTLLAGCLEFGTTTYPAVSTAESISYPLCAYSVSGV